VSSFRDAPGPPTARPAPWVELKRGPEALGAACRRRGRPAAAAGSRARAKSGTGPARHGRSPPSRPAGAESDQFTRSASARHSRAQNGQARRAQWGGAPRAPSLAWGGGGPRGSARRADRRAARPAGGGRAPLQAAGCCVPPVGCAARAGGVGAGGRGVWIDAVWVAVYECSQMRRHPRGCVFSICSAFLKRRGCSGQYSDKADPAPRPTRYRHAPPGRAARGRRAGGARAAHGGARAARTAPSGSGERGKEGGGRDPVGGVPKREGVPDRAGRRCARPGGPRRDRRARRRPGGCRRRRPPQPPAGLPCKRGAGGGGEQRTGKRGGRTLRGAGESGAAGAPGGPRRQGWPGAREAAAPQKHKTPRGSGGAGRGAGAAAAEAGHGAARHGGVRAADRCARGQKRYMQATGLSVCRAGACTGGAPASGRGARAALCAPAKRAHGAPAPRGAAAGGLRTYRGAPGAARAARWWRRSGGTGAVGARAGARAGLGFGASPRGRGAEARRARRQEGGRGAKGVHGAAPGELVYSAAHSARPQGRERCRRAGRQAQGAGAAQEAKRWGREVRFGGQGLSQGARRQGPARGMKGCARAIGGLWARARARRQKGAAAALRGSSQKIVGRRVVHASDALRCVQ
jgi:hypothetical protein